MSTGDRRRRLGVEPLETRSLPATLLPVATDAAAGIELGGMATVLVSPSQSVSAGSDSIDVTPRVAISRPVPLASAIDPDGDDPSEYAVQVDLANAVSSEMRLAAVKAPTPPTEAHETAGKTANDRREYKEEERAADSSRNRPLALPAPMTSSTAIHEAAGGHERRALSPSPPPDGPHDLSGPHRDYAPGYAANSPLAPPRADAVPRPPAAAGGGLRADSSVPAAPPPAPPPADVTAAEAGPGVSPEAALAELLSLDPAELERTAQDFLGHLADLAPGWCNEGRSWEYVWVAVGALLAGGLAHAAMVMRARGRMRLVECELENGNGCPRYR